MQLSLSSSTFIYSYTHFITTKCCLQTTNTITLLPNNSQWIQVSLKTRFQKSFLCFSSGDELKPHNYTWLWHSFKAWASLKQLPTCRFLRLTEVRGHSSVRVRAWRAPTVHQGTCVFVYLTMRILSSCVYPVWDPQQIILRSVGGDLEKISNQADLLQVSCCYESPHCWMPTANTIIVSNTLIRLGATLFTGRSRSCVSRRL